MAATNMINLKVFLRDDPNFETRRINVDASVVTSFLFIKEKLQAVFPGLRNCEFKITWKDADGDEITIANDEDLITALTEMNRDVKVLYVTVMQHNHAFMGEADAHDISYQGPRVICDICNQVITGFRYKCLQCPDYDLCASCEHGGCHSEHLMIRVPNNEIYMPKCARKIIHHVARTLKKSAHVANKEAHRAAKFSNRCGRGGEENKSHSRPGCSEQPSERAQECPFSGEAFTMNDIHALGAMARQHFAPIAEAFQTPASGTNANAEQGGVLFDIIRNAVDGFLGKTSGDSSTDNPQKEQAQPKQQQSGNENAAQTENPVETQPSPMDVEGTAHVNFANNAKNSYAQQGDTLPRRDPGWTFVTNTQAADNATKENAQNGQASAPTFVYHENPRIAEGLMRLHEMGFSNESGFLTRLLEKFEGDVAAVVKAILDMKV